MRLRIRQHARPVTVHGRGITLRCGADLPRLRACFGYAQGERTRLVTVHGRGITLRCGADLPRLRACFGYAQGERTRPSCQSFPRSFIT